MATAGGWAVAAEVAVAAVGALEMVVVWVAAVVLLHAEEASARAEADGDSIQTAAAHLAARRGG